jgi:hypothetical protein
MEILGGCLTGVEIPFQEYGQHNAALSSNHYDCKTVGKKMPHERLILFALLDDIRFPRLNTDFAV